jgi:hypothetical protein
MLGYPHAAPAPGNEGLGVAVGVARGVRPGGEGALDGALDALQAQVSGFVSVVQLTDLGEQQEDRSQMSELERLSREADQLEQDQLEHLDGLRVQREAEARLEAARRMHAEAEAEVERLRRGRSARLAAASESVADPGYGGEYLAKIVALLEAGKESESADASRTERLSRQAEVLGRLKAVIKARQSADPWTAARDSDTGEGGSHGAEGRQGLGFDAEVDDDEVLLRLMREVDADGSGTISMDEVLLRNKDNAEMARVLRRALGCDVRALEEAVEALQEADLALCLQGGAEGAAEGGAEGAGAVAGGSAGPVLSKGAAVKAIFDAIGPSQTVPPDAAQAGGVGEAEADGRMATRADLERFLAGQQQGQGPAPVQVSEALAGALKKLAASLPAEGQLDFLALKAAARKVPRVAAHRLEWVKTLDLNALLARHLPPGTLDDGCVVCLAALLLGRVAQCSQ